MEGKQSRRGKKRKEWRGLYLHSSLRPERRRCEAKANRSIFRAELTEEMWDVYDFLSHCFLPWTSPQRGGGGELRAVGAPPHAPPQLLYTLVFSEIGRRGLGDASQMLGSSINNRKRAIDLSFAELATILFPFLFCLLSLANGILILFDKRFYSMRFPLHEPRLMFRCFVVAGIHVALARTPKTSRSTFVLCWTFL